MVAKGTFLDPYDRLVSFKLAAVYFLLGCITMACLSQQEYNFHCRQDNATNNKGISDYKARQRQLTSACRLLMLATLVAALPGLLMWFVADLLFMVSANPLLNGVAADGDGSIKPIVETFQVIFNEKQAMSTF